MCLLFWNKKADFSFEVELENWKILSDGYRGELKCYGRLKFVQLFEGNF